MKKNGFHQFRSRSRKSVPLFPAAYCVDYLASNLTKNTYGMRVSSVVYAYTKDDLFALIWPRSDYKKMGAMFFDKFQKSSRYLSNLIKRCESEKDSLKDFLFTSLDKNTIRRLSNQELLKRYEKYVEMYRLFHLKNTPPWWIGTEVVETALRDYLKKCHSNDWNNILSKITEPLEYRTENLNEELSLLDIAAQIKKEKIKITRSKNSLSKKIERRVNSHIDEYSYIPFGYNTGVVWNKDYFLKKINKILLKDDPIKSKKNLLNSIKKKIKDREKIINGLKLPQSISKLPIILRQLSYLQELKKATQTKSHPHLRGVVNPEIARRLGIPKEQVDCLSITEIKYGLKNGRLPKKLLGDIKQRQKPFVLIMKDLKYLWLYKNKAQNFFEKSDLISDLKGVNQINGVVASLGHVNGIVKVCKLSTEIDKVKNGDVLVAAMTTPDFVPAMKRAAAIITDEGGITCHAAIISRELNKPCIIGTKIATQVLKDGDLVEVDTDTGIIRILK